MTFVLRPGSYDSLSWALNGFIWNIKLSHFSSSIFVEFFLRPISVSSSCSFDRASRCSKPQIWIDKHILAKNAYRSRKWIPWSLDFHIQLFQEKQEETRAPSSGAVREIHFHRAEIEAIFGVSMATVLNLASAAEIHWAKLYLAAPASKTRWAENSFLLQLQPSPRLSSSNA